MKHKIELSDLSEYANVDYRASIKQINFIQGLMKQNKTQGIFKKYFQIRGKNITTTITKKNATKLIKTLLDKKEYYFSEVIPEMKEGKLINPIKPNKTFSSDVPKITFQNNKFNRVSTQIQENEILSLPTRCYAKTK